MSPEAKALLYGIAVILFVLAAIFELAKRPARAWALGLVAAGLACATLPAFWDAWSLATA